MAKPLLSWLSLELVWVALLTTTSSYSTQPQPQPSWSEQELNRRAFVSTSSAAIAWSALVPESFAANINVTPVAHTFITSTGSPKPLRENDATRYLTNARVVYLLEGKDSNPALSRSIVELTKNRKADQGPGVTPGQIHVTASPSSASAVAAMASSLPEGDTLLVGPVPSGGVAVDGKLIRDTADELGVAVGGAKSGGVLSVLLDGPRRDLPMEESGYSVSTLLWYFVKP